jgi:hypothetical protein
MHFRLRDNACRYYAFAPPGNYGIVPQTWENGSQSDAAMGLLGDDEPLDVLVGLGVWCLINPLLLGGAHAPSSVRGGGPPVGHALPATSGRRQTACPASLACSRDWAGIQHRTAYARLQVIAATRPELLVVSQSETPTGHRGGEGADWRRLPGQGVSPRGWLGFISVNSTSEEVTSCQGPFKSR